MSNIETSDACKIKEYQYIVIYDMSSCIRVNYKKSMLRDIASQGTRNRVKLFKNKNIFMD